MVKFEIWLLIDTENQIYRKLKISVNIWILHQLVAASNVVYCNSKINMKKQA